MCGAGYRTPPALIFAFLRIDLVVKSYWISVCLTRRGSLPWGKALFDKKVCPRGPSTGEAQGGEWLIADVKGHVVVEA